jgi:hypothetical protein
LLFSEVAGLQQYFSIDTQRTDGFRKFNRNKVNFARDIVPAIDEQHFEIFRPMFEFIQSKITPEEELA